jgi:hypothetical protein
MSATTEHYSGLPAFLQPVWFAQPFLPTMQDKCEVRCFFIGEEWLYAAVSDNDEYGMMNVSPYNGCIPLENLL